MQQFLYIDDFLSLVEHNTFSAASKDRCITQPAFSRRIQLLEESLGTKLFNRNTNPIQLTESGKIFLTHAQQLHKSSLSAIQDIRHHLSALDNPIRISTSHTLAIACFPKLLTALNPQHNIPIKLNAKRIGQCVEDILGKQADFALIHTHKDVSITNKIEQHILEKDYLVAVHTPTCQSTKNLLAYSKDTGLSAFLQKCPQFTSHTQNITFESPSGEVLKALCLESHGTAIIPKTLIEKELERNELILNKALNINIELDISILRLKNTAYYERQEKIWKKIQKHEILSQ